MPTHRVAYNAEPSLPPFHHQPHLPDPILLPSEPRDSGEKPVEQNFLIRTLAAAVHPLLSAHQAQIFTSLDKIRNSMEIERAQTRNALDAIIAKVDRNENARVNTMRKTHECVRHLEKLLGPEQENENGGGDKPASVFDRLSVVEQSLKEVVKMLKEPQVPVGM